MFPVLTTERLLLRKVEQTDATAVLKGYSDPLVNRHMSVAYHSFEEVKTGTTSTWSTTHCLILLTKSTICDAASHHFNQLLPQFTQLCD